MFQAPSRFMIWFVLAFCLLAGVGVERWHTPTGRGLYWFRLATAGMASVTFGAILAGIFIKGDIHFSFIKAAALAGIWGLGGGILTLIKAPAENRGKQPIWEAAVMVWVCLDLISAGWNLNPSLPASFYQSMVPGNNPISQPVDGSRLYLNSNDEYLLKFARFFRFDDYSQIEDASHFGQVILPNVNLIKGISSINNFDPFVPARYAKWMDNLANSSADQVSPWLSLMDVGTAESLEIGSTVGVSFKSQATPARYYWTNCALFTATAEEAWTTLSSELSQLPEGQLFRNVVLEGDAKLAAPCDQKGSAIIDQTQESISTIQVVVSSGQNGWLVNSSTWYPGWMARIDGQNVPLLRANYLFQAVWLPAGIHKVEFIYRPTAFYAGICLSLLGIFGILAFRYKQKIVRK
jgi:hypothetical protein